MSYCDKWQLLGLAIGLSPLALAFLLIVIAARHPRRWWQGALLAFVVAAPVLVAGRIATLVLWNGVRPAICN